MKELRIRVTDQLLPGSRHIEVIDQDGQVLGDLTKTVADVRWTLKPGHIGVLSIDLAAECGAVETLAGR